MPRPWYASCSKAGMPDNIRQFDYHDVIVEDQPGAVARIVTAVCEKGIGLLAFSSLPHAKGQAQVKLISQNAGALARTLEEMGLSLSPKKSGFLVESDA